MTSPIPKTYTPTVYYDGQAGGTPVDADNLNKTEQALMNAFLRAMMFDVVPTAAKTGTYNANPSELVLANALSAAFPVILPAAYEGALSRSKRPTARRTSSIFKRRMVKRSTVRPRHRFAYKMNAGSIEARRPVRGSPSLA